jgi:uncharacterized membrane protein
MTRARGIATALAAVGALTLVVLALTDAGGLLALPRLALTVIFVLFLPGLSLTYAIFPDTLDLDGIERFALAFGLSLALISPLALILEASGAGIRAGSVLVIEGLVIVVCSLIAFVRRTPLHKSEAQRGVTLVAWWAAQRPLDRRLWLLLGVALAGVLLAMTASLLLLRSGSQFTEFYIERDYPRRATTGEPLVIPVGVHNREGGSLTYRIELTGPDDLRLIVDPFTLTDGETGRFPLALTIDQAGDDLPLIVNLYRSTDIEAPYRSLRLFIDVDAAP